MMTVRHDILASPVREVERLWLTRKGAADYLGVSVDYIKAKNLGGQLPYAKDEKLVFILKRDLDRMIEKMKVFN